MEEETIEDDGFDYEFTEEDIKILDERREKRLKGESLLLSWEEAKKIITQKSKPVKL
jgi:hypothetical protein